jgi:hypothetical protein
MTELREAVEEEISRRFPSALFEMLLKQHKKHGWKSKCECNYCTTKRTISFSRGWSRYLDDPHYCSAKYNYIKKTWTVENSPRQRLKQMLKKAEKN